MEVDLAPQTGGFAHQSLAEFRQDLTIDPWLVIESLQRRNGRKFQEVLVTLKVAGEQHHVVCRLIQPRLLLFATTWRDIRFDAQDGLNARRLTLRVEIRGPVHD